MALPTITVQGNLVADPELRFTPSGSAVANFRVAATKRQQTESGSWEDKDQLFITCSAWEQLAEHVVETFKKGMAVIVVGELRERSYEDREGVRRTVNELRVYDAGPSLKRASAEVKKVERTKAGEAGAPPAQTPDVPPF